MEDPGSTFLARIALEWKLIRPDQLKTCLDQQAEARMKGQEILLGQVLVDRGWLRAEDLERILKEQHARLSRAPGLTRYDLRERVGEGSTAVVYLAWDRELGRPVALKLLREEVSLDPLGRARFAREIEAARSLAHPNVVPVYDGGEASGRHFLVMELVKGKPLSDMFARRRPDELTICILVQKVASGVASAHAKGIVHRDLKPANILVTPQGEPKVTDFGLVRVAASGTAITQRGSALGTPMYMAPEQVAAKEVSPRTDVYALGAILYEGLTGIPPHTGRNDMEIYRRTMLDAPVPPSVHNDRVPPALESIVLRALEKPPDRRQADAGVLSNELKTFVEQEGRQLHQAPTPARMTAPQGRSAGPERPPGSGSAP
jgi:serine/threonine-protein kinase